MCTKLEIYFTLQCLYWNYLLIVYDEFCQMLFIINNYLLIVYFEFCELIINNIVLFSISIERLVMVGAGNVVVFVWVYFVCR